MTAITRRAVLVGGTSLGAAALVGACSTTEETPPTATLVVPTPSVAAPVSDPAYAMMYAAIPGERFPIPAVDLSKIDPAFLRREVAFPSNEAPGTIVIDPAAHYLYHVQPGGRATRYGVGVGKQGFEWSGVATINSKQEWPDWYPPTEMIARRPDIQPQLVQLQSGMGVAGGPRNPIGARGLYLWQNGKDTLFRIHGTTEPHTIGLSVSSGCIRMINQDVIDLYAKVPVGTEVKVLSARLV